MPNCPHGNFHLTTPEPSRRVRTGIRPDPSGDREALACVLWATPIRGDRTAIEILGERVTVHLKGSVVRIVVRQDQGLSQVITDFVERLEIHASRTRAPPRDRKIESELEG